MGTYQDPHQLSDEITFVSTEKRCDLIAMFNRGVSLSSGDFITFIRPGVELSQDWQLTVEDAFQKPHIASVSPLITTHSEPQKIVTAGVEAGIGFQRKMTATRWRNTPTKIKRVSPLGPTSWAAFYRRSAIEQIHPISENLDSVFFDLEIAMSLRTIGMGTAFSPGNDFGSRTNRLNHKRTETGPWAICPANVLPAFRCRCLHREDSPLDRLGSNECPVATLAIAAGGGANFCSLTSARGP